MLLCSNLDSSTRVCTVDSMSEKPSPATAKANYLATPEFGLPAGSVLCNFGMDILPRKVFAALRSQGKTPSGEMELRTAQADLLASVLPPPPPHLCAELGIAFQTHPFLALVSSRLHVHTCTRTCTCAYVDEYKHPRTRMHPWLRTCVEAPRATLVRAHAIRFKVKFARARS